MLKLFLHKSYSIKPYGILIIVGENQIGLAKFLAK